MVWYLLRMDRIDQKFNCASALEKRVRCIGLNLQGWKYEDEKSHRNEHSPDAVLYKHRTGR